MNKDCESYWAESDYLPVNAVLDYWCDNNLECKEAKKYAIIAACERGLIQFKRNDGKNFKDPIFELIDTIEVFNGRCTDRQNKFSYELCHRLNLKGIGGSDAHGRYDIPSCATLFERNITNLGEFITELKAGRFRAVDLRQDTDINHVG